MEERNTRFFKPSSQYCTKCKDEFFIQLTDMYCLLLMKEHQMNTKACIEICVIEKLDHVLVTISFQSINK